MGSLFSSIEIAGLMGGRRPPAPKSYALPTEFPKFDRAKRVSIDLESYDESLGLGKGPGWRRAAQIVGVAVAIQDKSGAIPFKEYYPCRHKGVTNLDPEKVYDWLSTELAFFTGDIVGANLLYDGDGLQYQQIEAPLAKWRDVQWAEALLDENAMSYKLNAIAQKHLKESKVTDELKLMYGPGYIERFMEVHPGHAKAYGIGDVELPIRVLDVQVKELKKQNLLDLFDLESRLMPMLLYMRRLGVRVDLAKAYTLTHMFAAKRDDALREASKISGVQLTAENFGKPTVMKLVFDRLGIKYPYLLGEGDKVLAIPFGHADYEKAVKQGKPSFRSLWLDNLDHPVAEFIQIANKCEKAKATFVDGYITDNAIGDRVHCEFHPLRKKKDENEKSQGTITGRFSGSNPNLQNIPARDEEIGPLCRSMFVADEGARWWSQDYSQIEYRMLIHFAVEYGCKGANIPRDMYIAKPDTDFHDMCAAMMYAADWNELDRKLAAGEITKEQCDKGKKKLRKPAKNLNFGMVYGMGEAKLANSLGETNPDGTPNETATRIMKEYHAAAPYIKDLNKYYVNFAEKHEYITTILNRRGRFPLWEPKFTERNAPRVPALPYEQAVEAYGEKIKVSMTHKALNKALQGSAADLMKLAMVQMWEAGLFAPGNDINVSLTVHDELNGSYLPTKRGEQSLREVKYMMENAMKLHIPILTSGATGLNWSEAK